MATNEFWQQWQTAIFPVIDVDRDEQPTASTATEGALYGKKQNVKRAEAANLAPLMLCPNCPQVVTALDVAHHYTRPDGSRVDKIPPCPVQISATSIFYTALPCRCRVSTEWAGLWSGEMNERLLGVYPRSIKMPEAARQAHLTRYEKDLARLHKYRADPVLGGPTQDAAAFWEIVVTDIIQRLCPGAANKQLLVQPGGKLLSGPSPVGPGWSDEILSEYDEPGYGALFPLPKKPAAKVAWDPAAGAEGGAKDLSTILALHNSGLLSGPAALAAAGYSAARTSDETLLFLAGLGITERAGLAYIAEALKNRVEEANQVLLADVIAPGDVKPGWLTAVRNRVHRAVRDYATRRADALDDEALAFVAAWARKYADRLLTEIDAPRAIEPPAETVVRRRRRIVVDEDE